MKKALCIQAKPANSHLNRDGRYELYRSKKIEGQSFHIGAPCVSAGHTYNIKATSFMQPINVASPATTFILTLRMARASSQNAES